MGNMVVQNCILLPPIVPVGNSGLSPGAGCTAPSTREGRRSYCSVLLFQVFWRAAEEESTAQDGSASLGTFSDRFLSGFDLLGVGHRDHLDHRGTVFHFASVKRTDGRLISFGVQTWITLQASLPAGGQA